MYKKNSTQCDILNIQKHCTVLFKDFPPKRFQRFKYYLNYLFQIYCHPYNYVMPVLERITALCLYLQCLAKFGTIPKVVIVKYLVFL